MQGRCCDNCREFESTNEVMNASINKWISVKSPNLSLDFCCRACLKQWFNREVS